MIDFQIGTCYNRKYILYDLARLVETAFESVKSQAHA